MSSRTSSVGPRGSAKRPVPVAKPALQFAPTGSIHGGTLGPPPPPGFAGRPLSSGMPSRGRGGAVRPYLPPRGPLGAEFPHGRPYLGPATAGMGPRGPVHPRQASGFRLSQGVPGGVPRPPWIPPPRVPVDDDVNFDRALIAMTDALPTPPQPPSRSVSPDVGSRSFVPAAPVQLSQMDRFFPDLDDVPMDPVAEAAVPAPVPPASASPHRSPSCSQFVRKPVQ
jgi:hypothetical protein